MDQNSKPTETEAKINITLVINQRVTYKIRLIIHLNLEIEYL